jgi:predicted acetyltransferase
MGGIASVSVHPDARGRGLSTALMRELLPVMRAAGQPVSVLFPTAPGVYRAVGWELVGSLDDTTIDIRDLEVADVGGATVRTAGPADVPAIASLYAGLGASISGLLTRDGIEFPTGAEAVLEHDVVALAVAEGDPVGFATYSRGTGYGTGSQLRGWDFVASTAPAAAALLRSLASWRAVAPTMLWRGATDELALHLRAAVPPPSARQPWMLRIVDAPAAIALRGYPVGVGADCSFVLHDPDVAGHTGPWRLVIRDGRGRLERLDEAGGLPHLHIRGLALLYAGAANTALLRRIGHLDGPLPGVDAAFATRSEILDYF